MRDFHHSVNVLVKAYLNNTLVHSNCYACAVGNIVADAMGYFYKKCHTPRKKIKWSHVEGDSYFQDDGIPDWYEQIINHSQPSYLSLQQIQSTGYTDQELLRIERAFERSDRGFSEDDWMFNGLMAVVSVLAEIHNIDLETTEKAKALFVKH